MSQVKSCACLMAVGAVLAGSGENATAGEHPQWGGMNHPHHITYYHPGYFETNPGIFAASPYYPAGHVYGTSYLPAWPYGHHYAAPFGGYGASYGPAVNGWYGGWGR